MLGVVWDGVEVRATNCRRDRQRHGAAARALTVSGVLRRGRGRASLAHASWCAKGLVRNVQWVDMLGVGPGTATLGWQGGRAPAAQQVTGLQCRAAGVRRHMLADLLVAWRRFTRGNCTQTQTFSAVRSPTAWPLPLSFPILPYSHTVTPAR